MLTREILDEKVSVVAIADGYYRNTVIRPGQKFKVERMFFSNLWMRALDAKGKVLRNQPEKLNTKEVKYVLEEEQKEKDDVEGVSKDVIAELGLAYDDEADVVSDPSEVQFAEEAPSDNGPTLEPVDESQKDAAGGAENFT